uniref:jerky protein homolog-like n=1 Tax=Osmia lignaria TaxID=473952 RepID=UPI0014791E36|nr:jerky protein homolog-like [Osmia lignaria]
MPPPLQHRLALKKILQDRTFVTQMDQKLIDTKSNRTSRKEEITLGKRLEILQKLDNGANLRELAAEYGINKRTMQRYRKNAASIRKLSESSIDMGMKRRRASLHEDVSTRLHAWIIERRASGETLTDSMLQEKAKQLHEEIGGSSYFAASRGWLWRFKKRYNLRSVGIHKEKPDENELAVDKFAKELTELLAKENIDEDNIYNMEETRLMWKILPQKILEHDEEQLKEKKKDHITIAFCANATGTCKLPLLIVNKYPNPRALKHCRHLLPVIYKSENNTELDETIFRDWYINHFKPSVRQHLQQKQGEKKVLLLVDNFRRNMLPKEAQNDSHFKLIFLPSYASSAIQSLEQGIIEKFKKLFRYKLLNRVAKFDGGVRQFYADYDIKDCIDLINESWNEITVTNIKTSWNKLLNRSPLDENIEQDLKIKMEEISSTEIAEWISECEEAEASIEETTEQKEEINAQPCCRIEEEEIYRMFHNLTNWAETEPEFVKFTLNVA